MLTTRKFFTKSFTVHLLSDQPFPDGECLGCALSKAEDGKYMIEVDETPAVELDGKQAADHLIAHDAKPSLLGLNAEGEDSVDIDEDDLFECQNCNHVAPYDDFPPAKDMFERFEIGEPFTDVECPACGALAYPVEEVEQDDDAEALGT